ncbi:outer membrane beta-barrel protein [Flavobacterium sp. ANB]|uniref:outer membrane beta-barrel protein n=1 Tax=unclassified Flavobacterium TaxID=196869 RepID=UPI0012B82D5A|nr:MULTISPECIES: outer membrane beta-barrel protein [unclassified Flavobacterium]MBF4516797.1 outer membrane beta-barrel protein [Flavobacterium sp. ANB]MTD69307.1 outer membrane beta-barrel protein [Flavobacterium sp. LC2016-13]
MKKYNLLFVIFLFSFFATAQQSKSFLLNLYGGYTFSDKVEYDNTYGYVEDGFEYGAGLEYFFIENSSVELKYNRLDTKLPLYGPLGTQINAGDDKGAINYVLLDYTHYFDTGSKALPYLGAGAGVSILETPQSGTGTYFAWEIKGGLKIKTDSPLSVNINAYLQSMSAAVGNSYYWTYYGVVGATDYVSTYQFGLGISLSYDFTK